MGMFDGMIEKEAKKADLDHDGVPDMDQLGAIEKKAEHGFSVVVAAIDHDVVETSFKSLSAASEVIQKGVNKEKMTADLKAMSDAFTKKDFSQLVVLADSIDFATVLPAMFQAFEALDGLGKAFHPEDAKAGFTELKESLTEGQAYIAGVMHKSKK